MAPSGWLLFASDAHQQPQQTTGFFYGPSVAYFQPACPLIRNMNLYGGMQVNNF